MLGFFSDGEKDLAVIMSVKRKSQMTVKIGGRDVPPKREQVEAMWNSNLHPSALVPPLRIDLKRYTDLTKVVLEFHLVVSCHQSKHSDGFVFGRERAK